MLLEDIHLFMNHNYELLKWMNRPAPEALKALSTDDAELTKLKKAGWVAPGLFTASLLRLKMSQARCDQRLAFNMTIEALRMHAAENKGEFPAKLADMSVVVPNDPVTGKPYNYDVKEGKATLHGTPATKVDQYNLHFVLTLRK